MRNLKEIFDAKKSIIKTLPILHSCEAINVFDILKDGVLKTAKCDVFDEDYLYTFYGIPSYRKNALKITGNPGYYPVCFIFDYDLIQNVYRLHPCDTGAFSKLEEIKLDHFHNSVELTNLELDPEIEQAKQLVTKFYNTNDNYIRQRPQLKLEEIGVINQPAYGYTSLIHDKSLTTYDNRVATIELIFNDEMLMSKDNLIQIIVPAIYLDEPEIKDLIENKYQINNPLIYESMRGTINENFGAIYNLYLNFVKRNNLS